MLFNKAMSQVNVGFTVNNAVQCINNNLFVFTNTTIPDSNITYYWTFDDGTTSTQTNPTKSYTQARTFNVTLIATVSGINYYYSQQVTVEPIPQVSYNIIKGTYSGASFTFISTSTISSGSMNYYWEFGDGTTSTLINPTKTYLQTGVNEVKLRVTGNTGCGDSITKTVYPILCTVGNWLGQEDCKWNNVNNWCIATIPVSQDTIRILKGCVNMPILDSAIVITSHLQIDSNSTLYIKKSATLQVNNSIHSYGYILADSGNIILSASQNQSIYSIYDYTIQNLTLNNNGRTSLLGSGILNITGILQFANNTNYDTLYTNGKLVIASTEKSTATVADITNGNTSWGNTITGEVTVQRFLQGKRAWRLLTAPVTAYNTSQDGSLFTNWQNGGTYIAGKGTLITGPGGVNGYDPAINQNYGLQKFNAKFTRWDKPIATNTTYNLFNNAPSAANQSYCIFVRGDRSIPSSSNASLKSTTTLEAKGTLQQGTQTFNTDSLAANAFYLVGNPYASAVDFDKVVSQSTNIAPKFYMWNSGLADVGAYITCSWNGSSYIQCPQTIPNQPNIIQSGEAFFVNTLNAGISKVVFTEQCKASNATTTVMGAANHQTDLIAINLYKLDSTKRILLDGVVKMYGDNFKDTIGVEDAVKFSNIDENIGILSYKKILAIEGRKYLTINDTIQLNMTNLKQANYQIEIMPKGMDATIANMLLIDRYTNTKIPVATSFNTQYNFTVNTDSGSFAKNRFSIELLPSNTLSNNSFSLIAYENMEKTRLHWSIKNIANVDKFEVEQRINNNPFLPFASIDNDKFNYEFINQYSSETEFRIKASLKNDNCIYTNVVKLKANTLNGYSFKIYPNVIHNNTINFTYLSKKSELLKLCFYNSNGTLVNVEQVSAKAGINTGIIGLSKILASGIYSVVLKSDIIQYDAQKINILN